MRSCGSRVIVVVYYMVFVITNIFQSFVGSCDVKRGDILCVLSCDHNVKPFLLLKSYLKQLFQIIRRMHGGWDRKLTALYTLEVKKCIRKIYNY